MESVKILPARTRIGGFREQVAARRGKNIAAVAAARRQLEYVYYALRDGHVRDLDPANQGRPRPAAAAVA